MTTYFISRHPGALQWMQQHGPAFDQHITHLDITRVQPGDRIIGTLPINLAAEVCQRGADYWHLTLEVPAHQRGQELSAADLQAMNVHLQQFHITTKKENPTP